MLRHYLAIWLWSVVCCASPAVWAERFNPAFADATARSSTDELPLDEIQQFVSIYNLVKENYVSEKNDAQLFLQATQGLVAGLDPYSRYLTADQYQALLHYTEGDLATVDFGVQYDASTQQWRIHELNKSADAYAAGLRNGQVLSKLEQQNLSQLPVEQVPKLLLGGMGSSLSLQTSSMLRPITVLRTVKINSEVRAQLLSNQVLWIQVNVFQQDTANQLKSLLSAVQNNHAKAVLIDLRNNPGGLLSAAVECADLFLSKGVIVSTKSRAEGNQQFQAFAGNDFPKIKLGVLMNGRSASAAEVFAAAIQVPQRAVIIGERSYGKGVVQKLFPLPTGAAVQMTVSHYYTPKGEMIDGKGIQPDLILPQASNQDDAHYVQQAATLLLP